jgi:hypothetical protein
VERRTYVATSNSTSDITLYRDHISGESSTSLDVVSSKITDSKDTVFMDVVPDDLLLNHDNLLIVRQDGEIQCLDSQTLDLKWSSAPTAISRDSSVPYVLDVKIEFAQTTDAYSAIEGLLKDREDTLTVFSQAIDRETFNPTILIVVTSPSEIDLQSTRTLHVLALPQVSIPSSNNKVQSVHTLFTLQLPWGHMETPAELGEISYNLQSSSGVLYELAGGYLTSFDLSGSVPQVKTKLAVDGSSFIPLSQTSIVTTSHKTMSIYHPVFRSIQASIDLRSALDSEITPKKRKLNEVEVPSKSCRLVAHSLKQGVVIAISGSNLLSFQIDARRDKKGKHRSLGLLIDSIGCGVLNSDSRKPAELEPLRMNSLGRFIPGSTDDGGAAGTMEELDALIETHQIENFERKMAAIVGLAKIDALRPNGVTGSNHEKKPNDQIPSSWIWPNQRSEYPQYDPIWAQYAISRIFSWSNDRPTESMRESVTAGECRLHVVFDAPNVIYWLIQTGNLNKIAITSALQSEMRASGASEIPAGQIVKCLVDIDPEMNLLLSLLSSTYLEAAELLYAIQMLMDSLGIFGDKIDNPLMLTNDDQPNMPNGNIDAEIESEAEQADADLQLAEYRLGDGSSVRHQALSIAFAKVYTCPSTAVVLALQSTMTLSEMVSLIYLLRFELAGGSWTSRYLDLYQSSDDAGPPDSAIMLISTLLSRCIDAVGAGGWLSGDAMLVNGDHFESEELILSLKLEVSAALEGVEEATYLRGLTSEMIKFAESTSRATGGVSKQRTKGGNMKPVVMRLETEPLLPMGLKTEQQISLQKVGAGGELYTRSMRDIGRLKSRRVKDYQIETITF